MGNDYEFTINELLEEAKKDPSWEPDAEKRAKLVNRLIEVLDDV